MFNPIRWLCGLSNKVTCVLNFFGHFAALGVRYYLFTIFFFSGWLKTKSWSSTIALFENEYSVSWVPLPPPWAEYLANQGVTFPAMPPMWAAYIGTGLEIALPVLLLVGLGARLPALGLFIFNFAVLSSYPALWTDAHIAGFKDHIIWASMIGFLMFYGSGKITLDQLFCWKCKNYKT